MAFTVADLAKNLQTVLDSLAQMPQDTPVTELTVDMGGYTEPSIITQFDMSLEHVKEEDVQFAVMTLTVTE